MPRQVFSDAMEEKLIELWAEFQKDKAGSMMKRSKKEKEIAQKLNLYAKAIGEADVDISQSVVHNKLDNIKAKAKEHYKRFKKATATGSAVDSTSDDAYDLEKAFALWGNFRTWHRLFRGVPGFGPLQTVSSVSVVADSIPPPSASAATLPPPLEVPAAISESPRSSSSASSSVSSESPQTPTMSKHPERKVAGTGEDSEEEEIAAKCAHAVTTPVYKPGSLKKKFAPPEDAEEDGDAAKSSSPLLKKKKKQAISSSALAAGNAMMQAFSDTQRELQNSQQAFLTSLMKEQREHTQMLAQGQMKFQADLVKGLFGNSKSD